jgi:hypothetical protein
MNASPLRPIKSSSDGYAMSINVINQIIERIEYLIQTAESQKPIAGDGIRVEFTPKGAIVSLR